MEQVDLRRRIHYGYAIMDEGPYRHRHNIQRLFGRRQQDRRLATRYEKTVVFWAPWYLAEALYGLR